jgi:hypothetical protein
MDIILRSGQVIYWSDFVTRRRRKKRRRSVKYDLPVLYECETWSHLEGRMRVGWQGEYMELRERK